MLPGMGGMNPKKMNAMMKQMGISQEDIDASRVIIEKPDNSRMIIDNPEVSKMTIQGQEMFQVSGGSVSEDASELGDESTEESGITEETSEEGITEEDIQTVMDKTQCTREKAQEILEKNNGDLAESIMELSE